MILTDYKIYMNKTGPVKRRLKVQIGRRRYAVGDFLPDKNSFIVGIHRDTQSFDVVYASGYKQTFRGINV